MAVKARALLTGWVPKSAMKRREAVWGYLFALPLLLGFLSFALGPMLASIGISFTDWEILTTPKFIGVDNYVKALTKDRLIGIAFGNTSSPGNAPRAIPSTTKDRLIGIAFGNTIYLMIGIPIGMAGSLLLALAMNQRIRGISLFRTLYFLPVVSSVVAVSVLWRWIFNPEFGLFNVILRYLGLQGPLWLGDPAWAKPALIIMGVWGGLGFNMLLYLAALR